MQLLKKGIEQLIVQLRKLQYIVIKPQKKSFLHKNVPYYSQWESRSLVSKFLNHELSPQKDPRWRYSGAAIKEEYELWSWNACGMACLKSILAKELKKVVPIVTLGKKCMQYGGYRSSTKKGDIQGLFYEPFLKFIQKEFGLNGSIASPMILEEIVYQLSRKNYVIASVSPEIRNPEKKSTKHGGHLVLVLGYDLKRELLYLHNPSGIGKTQSYTEITFFNFQKFFAGRGILILGKKVV